MNQWHFARFLIEMVEAGALADGDVLILDNASTHWGKATRAMIAELLHVAGVRLLFLPTYSPELNPTEFVWGRIKNYLRYHRLPTSPLWLQILMAATLIDNAEMLKYYMHCLNNFSGE
jgi:transposase